MEVNESIFLDQVEINFCGVLSRSTADLSA